MFLLDNLQYIGRTFLIDSLLIRMENFVLKTRKEIADDLSISISTLRRYMKKENIDLPKGRYLKPSEYRQIYAIFEV